jgi:hypothetical protein
MWKSLAALGSGACVVALGCSADDRAVGYFGTEATGQSQTQGSMSTDASAASTGAEGGDTGTGTVSTSGGIKLDVAAPDGGVGGCIEGRDCGCTAVDILFVIDNSGSMCLYQENLAAAFAGFADAIYDALPPGTDLHVGITTSGFELGGSHSESNCEAAESVATIDQYYVRPTEGMVAGNGLQGRLFEHQGLRYYEVDTGDAGSKQGLADWFAGAATAVDCSVSSFEFDGAGAAWALHDENAAYNDGFLRDAGAALVVFVLSDEADQSLDVETLDFLHDTVVAAKSECGGDECIVTGGLLSPWCTPDNNNAYTFLASFGEDPVWGSIGSPNPFDPPPDYSAVVGDALAQIVAQTCENIPPVG